MKRWLMLLMAFPLFASAAAERIVSLGGDVTEVVYALDAQQQLVAKDSTSTWPATAQSLPDVGYIRQLNAEGILSLRPTLVLASAQAQPSLVQQSAVTSTSVAGMLAGVMSAVAFQDLPVPDVFGAPS